MNGLGDSVWGRDGDATIPRSVFNLVMMVTILFGLAITTAAAYQTIDWFAVRGYIDGKPDIQWVGPINIWVLFVGVLVVSIAGIWIALSSSNPIISLLGFIMVAYPMGLIMGPTVGLYTPESVMKVVFITAMVVAVLGLLGAMIPQSLESWSAYLFGGLIILLVGMFAIPILRIFIPDFPIREALTVWDWVGVVLFSLYIIFDANRAQKVPATVDNAIDCALALYLDIINLFIRLLELYAKAKR